MGKIEDLRVFFMQNVTIENVSSTDINMTNIVVAAVSELHKALVIEEGTA